MMMRKILYRRFSDSVRFIDPTRIAWFPGHINKSIQKINQILKTVDFVIEIHDARLIFNGRPNLFRNLDLVRPRMLVYNKVDLAENFSANIVKEKLCSEQSNLDPEDIVFTQLNQRENTLVVLKSLFLAIKRKIIETDQNEELFNKKIFIEEKPITCLVVGLPNCGKSTFITALRSVMHGKNKATRVGRNAGETKSISQPIIISRKNMKINGFLIDRNIQMIDTPGILEPLAHDLVTQLSLASLGMLNHQSIDKKIIVDYLLFLWNYKNFRGYINFLELDGVIDNVDDLILKTAKIHNFVHPPMKRSSLIHTFETYEDYEKCQAYKTGFIDMDKTLVHILNGFCRGKMGRFSINPEDEFFAQEYFKIKS